MAPPIDEMADVPLDNSGAHNGSGASGEGEEFQTKVCTYVHRM